MQDVSVHGPRHAVHQQRGEQLAEVSSVWQFHVSVVAPSEVVRVDEEAPGTLDRHSPPAPPCLVIVRSLSHRLRGAASITGLVIVSPAGVHSLPITPERPCQPLEGTRTVPCRLRQAPFRCLSRLGELVCQSDH